MRLPDRLTISRDGAPLGDPLRAYFGHKGGSTADESPTGNRPFMYSETASALVDVPELLVPELTENPNRYSVTYRGMTYQVDGVQPRYQRGVLHHVTLELMRVEG